MTVRLASLAVVVASTLGAIAAAPPATPRVSRTARADHHRAQPAAITRDTLRLAVAGHARGLAGTLTVPDARGPVPLVVIVPGSGPTDRDGNNPLGVQAGSYRLLAESLAVRGIATLRYDKRGIGASADPAMREEALRFDAGADDAAAWVRRLRDDRRFGAIAVVGHSEGSLLGMLATERAPADGFVSVAGIGRRADQVLRTQLARQLPPPLLADASRTLDSLVAGRTVADPPPMLAALFRPSVQPYLISWFRVDPAVEVARRTVPVLLAQGTRDLQVDSAEVRPLAAAAPRARLLLVEGMNHTLKLVDADATSNQRAYQDPTLPVAPALVEAIATFARALPPPRR